MSDRKSFVLMRRDEPVMTFSAYKYHFDEITSVITPELMPIGAGRSGKTFEKWWDARIIPYRRIKFLESLPVSGISNPNELVFLTHGLSLLNQYWIREENEDLKWKEINLFENDFSEFIGKALFNRRSFSSEDFPPLYRFSPEGMSPGDQTKRWHINNNNERVLIKTDNKGEKCVNELLASSFAEQIGLPYTDYILGIEDGKFICSSKCFTSENTEIIHAMDLLYEFGLPEIYKKTDYYYNYVIDLFEKMGVQNVREFIDKMLSIDYVMCQTDRHYNNFGILRNIDTEACIMAPLYDSGDACRNADLTQFMDVNSDVLGKPFGPNGQVYQNEQFTNVKSRLFIDEETVNKVVPSYIDNLNRIGVSEERQSKLVSSLLSRTEKMKGIFQIGVDVTPVGDVIPDVYYNGYKATVYENEIVIYGTDDAEIKSITDPDIVDSINSEADLQNYLEDYVDKLSRDYDDRSL